MEELLRDGKKPTKPPRWIKGNDVLEGEGNKENWAKIISGYFLPKLSDPSTHTKGVVEYCESEMRETARLFNPVTWQELDQDRACMKEGKW